jgi:hypothetical protein
MSKKISRVVKMQCPHCQTENPEEAKFCMECGQSLESEQEYIPPPNPAWTDLCPACNYSPLEPKTVKGMLSTKELLECDYCGAVFEKKGSKYKLKDIYDKGCQFWQRYRGKILTEEEWTRIAKGGISNEEQRIIEEKERKKQQLIEEQTAQNDLVTFVNQLAQGTVNLTPLSNPPIILKKKEVAYLVLGNISFHEPRAVRKTYGGYAGPTIRVTKGVSFRVGSVAARSESHEELRKIDQGTLVLTNKRLIFTGSKRTINIDLRKIIAIEAYKDGVASQRENKQKTEYFIGSNRSTLTFTTSGRRHTVPFTGPILKAAIQGQISQT